MPIRLGSSSALLRLGSTAVTRAYLGATQVVSAGGGGTSPPGAPDTPPQPNIVFASGSTGSAVLSWQAASIPSTTSWVVQWSADGGASWTPVPSTTPVASSFATGPTETLTTVRTASATITLPSGLYVFRVAGKAGSVVGPYSNASQSITISTAMSAPSITSLAADGPYVLLEWDNAGSQSAADGTVKHFLEKTEDNGTTWTFAAYWEFGSSAAKRVRMYGFRHITLPPPPSDPTSTYVTNASFDPGKTYKFRLRRRLCRGTSAGSCVDEPLSAWSATSGELQTPGSPPGAVRVIKVEAGPYDAYVTFAPPFSLGSSAVTNYSFGVRATHTPPNNASGGPFPAYNTGAYRVRDFDVASIGTTGSPAEVLYSVTENGQTVPVYRLRLDYVSSWLQSGAIFSIWARCQNASGVGQEAENKFLQLGPDEYGRGSAHEFAAIDNPSACRRGPGNTQHASVILRIPRHTFGWPIRDSGSAFNTDITPPEEWPIQSIVRPYIAYARLSDLRIPTSNLVANVAGGLNNFPATWPLFRPTEIPVSAWTVIDTSSGFAYQGSSGAFREFTVQRTSSGNVGPWLEPGVQYVFAMTPRMMIGNGYTQHPTNYRIITPTWQEPS